MTPTAPGQADVRLRSRRLFTALFPPAEIRAAIDVARRGWVDLPRRLRPVPERMHVTLQFFGQVMPERQAAWGAALAELRFTPFEIAFERVEIWRAPHGAIAVLRAAPNPALDALHAMTDELACRANLALEKRRWKPHLTALRQARALRAPRLAAPLCWRVDAVHWIWSDVGCQPPRYVSLGRFPARADHA